MNRKYEGLIVLNTKGKEDSVDELVGAVAKEMEAAGAKLDEIKQMGRRTHTYYFYMSAPSRASRPENRR